MCEGQESKGRCQNEARVILRLLETVASRGILKLGVSVASYDLREDDSTTRLMHACLCSIHRDDI